MSDRIAEIAEKAAQGGLFLFSGNFFSTLILAVGAIIVARLLGPSSYGLYALSLVIPELLASLTDLGINYALIRFPSKLRFESKHYEAFKTVRLGFLLKLSSSVVAFAICYSIAESLACILNRPELAPLVRLASALILFQPIFYAAIQSFIGLDYTQYGALIQILQSTTKTVLAPILILYGLGVAGAILAYVASFLGAALIGVLILVMKYIRLKAASQGISDNPLEAVRVMLGYSLPLYLTTILGVFLSQFQNIVLAFFATNSEIGNFNVTLKFAALMSVVSYPMASVIFPVFSKIAPHQRRELATLFRLIVKYTSLLIIPTSVAVMILSRDLISALYGVGYDLASEFLVMYGALFLLTGLGYLVLENLFNGIGDTKTTLKIGIITVAIFAPLAPTMTWLWHIRGLITALIVSNGFSTLYGMSEASKRYGVYPDLKANGKIYLTAIVAAIPTVILLQTNTMSVGTVSLVVAGSLYLVSFLTFAPILGAMNKSDIENLTAILAKIPKSRSLTQPVLRYEARILSIMSKLNG